MITKKIPLNFALNGTITIQGAATAHEAIVYAKELIEGLSIRHSLVADFTVANVSFPDDLILVYGNDEEDDPEEGEEEV